MKSWFSELALITLLVLSPRAQAVLLRPLAIEEMARKADVIVQGTVETKTCRRNPQGRLYTLIELRVAEVWKGNVSSNTFTLVCDGGVLGDEVQSSSVPVEYELGEEVVAMVRLNPHGLGVTLGLVQGKFRVWTDPRTGAKFAHNAFHGEAEPPAAPPGRSQVNAPPTDADGRLTLSGLKQQVEAAQR